MGSVMDGSPVQVRSCLLPADLWKGISDGDGGGGIHEVTSPKTEKMKGIGQGSRSAFEFSDII